jgi:TonB-linked SusC/RagA family outer membrane protein
MLLCGSATAASAQTRSLTGKIVDRTTSQPLADVQIHVAGTRLGALSTDSGTFSLRVPTTPVTLDFLRIGYKRVQVQVAADQNVVPPIAMERDVLKLQEMVVTGQATSVERRNLANAVSTVDADQLAPAPSQSVIQALQGKVAGANIQSNSGAPGGGIQMRLRGVTSIIGSHEPLYVLDGVIISNEAISSGTNSITQAASATSVASNEDNPTNRLADLNPDDIASIEVLKGASASAIYGSKASNGVVIITSKHGQPGKTRFRLRQQVGLYELSNTLGARVFETEADAEAAFGPEAANYFEPGVVYDHDRDLAGRKPLSYSTLLSASGGTDRTQFFVSALNQHDGGIIANTYYDKQSLRTNLHQLVGSRLTFNLNLTAAHSAAGRSITNNDNTGTSLYATMPGVPSFIDLRQQADGSWPFNPFGSSNPLQTAALLRNDESVHRFIGGSSIDFAAITTASQTLDFKFVAGVDYFNQANSLYSPPDLQYEQLFGQPGTSILSGTNNLNLNINTSAVHTFSPRSDAFTATSQIGVQYELKDQDLNRTLAKNLGPDLSNIDLGTSVRVEQNRQRVKDLGFFIQEEVLTLSDRLLLTAALRADRSSSNSSPRLFYYPKGAVSLRFPIQSGSINEVKVRAAIGESGNEPLYGQKFTEFQPANIAGTPTTQLQGSVAAEDLRPEREREIEGGVDVTLFGSRAVVSVTGYEKRITDLLLPRGLASSSGFSTEYFNGGVMRTRGLELQVTGLPIQRSALQWKIDGSLALNRSKVLSLPVPPFSPGGFGSTYGGFQIEEGKSPTQIIGNDTLSDGTSVIQQIGEARPDFTVGLNNHITAGRFDLRFLWNWQQGGDVINLTKLLYDFAQNSADYDTPHTADGETMPLGEWRLATWSRQTGIYVEDATFLKLREVAISYDLPESLVSGLWSGLRSARVSLSGRNLLTFTKYSGFDPEVSNFGNQAIARNTDVGPFPPSRSFWMSIDLGF